MCRGGFYRGGGIQMSAIAGIDQALWDIKGKALSLPICDLLGGRVRDKIRIYSWIGGDRPSDTAEAAKKAVAVGFTAVKMNGTQELQYIDTHDKVDTAFANVAAVRDAIGPDRGIGIDFHRFPWESAQTHGQDTGEGTRAPQADVYRRTCAQ